MLESGRLRTHHAPRVQKQNFWRRDSAEGEIKEPPGYILDSFGQPTALERKKSHEKEQQDKLRRQKLRKCLAWFFIVLAVLLVIIAVAIVLLYFLTCVLGNCPDGCHDCYYDDRSYWSKYGNGAHYSGKQRYCGDSLEIQITENTFFVDRSLDRPSGKSSVDTMAPLINSHKNTVDGEDTNVFEFYWYMEDTVRDNDTLTLVFSDNGDHYAGLGDFGSSVFRPKNNNDIHTLWARRDSPMYLPFYVSRNSYGGGSGCMFVDAQGSPMEVKVTSSQTIWTIYRHDKIHFHMYSDLDPYRAVTKCTRKWQQLYPSSEASWSNDFLIGSLTTQEIKTARTTPGLLGTHFVLSPDSISINTRELHIENEEVISGYENVFLSWSFKQNLADSGLSLTSDDGFYESDQQDFYYLDYSADAVRVNMATALAQTTKAGVVLLNGFNEEKDTEQIETECPRAHYCTAPTTPFTDWDSSMCLVDDFGGKTIIEQNNLYEKSRTDALRSSSGDLMLESVAFPGSTHFHRTDLKLTLKGLRTCFNNILNLHLIGIRAVTCNMCAGVVPQETDVDQSLVCDRWSQIALIMPYVAMTNDQTPPLITDELDAGRFVRNNLNVRQQFRFFLEAAFRAAHDNKTPFVYTVDSVHPSLEGVPEYDTDREHTHGILIGPAEEPKLFFAAVIEEPSPAADLQTYLPPGSWYSNGGPLTGEYYNGGRIIDQRSTDMSNLFYFEVPSIFVIEDKDNDNQAIIRVFLPYDDYQTTITYTLDYQERGSTVKHTAQIVFNSESGSSDANLEVTYTSPGSSLGQDIKVSAVEVYLWFEDRPLNAPAWAAYNSRGDNKYNVVLDYNERLLEDGTPLPSLFKSWTQELYF